MNEEQNTTVKDKADHELKVGDTVCFTISMRIDSKPIVRATIKEIQRGKQDWLVVEYIDSHDVDWGRRENKLPARVKPSRVVKCY